MKNLLLLASLLTATMPGWSQGYVNFSNLFPPGTARVTNGNSGTMGGLASGNSVRAMLYIGPAGTKTYSAMTTNGVEGPSSSFLTGAQAGYFNGGKRAITGYSPGDTITAQVRVWDAVFSSWEAAPNGSREASNLLGVKLAPTAAGASNLVGLQPMTIWITAGPQPHNWIVSNATVAVGDTATLAPNFYGSSCPPPLFCADPPVTYTWSFQGQAISFAYTLMITNVQPTNAGTYTFRIENESGWVERTATIALSSPSVPTLISPILTNGGFQFRLTGETGSNYVIQSSTDLAASNWVSRVTNTAPFTFVETDLSLSPQQFYRAIKP